MTEKTYKIKEKGFKMPLESYQAKETPDLDFSHIKIGLKTLEDAIFNIGDYKKIEPRLANKHEILRAIRQGDYATMRDVSNLFYKISGIYNRLCRYLAYMYRFDWMIVPYINSQSVKTDKVLDSFNKALAYLDNFQVKKFLGEVSLKVVRNGCYYGYLIDTPQRMLVQQLPCKYCRSRFTAANGRPVVEFNVKFFDDAFKDVNQKMKMLNLFPDEIKKGYLLYKQGKLPKDFNGDTAGWHVLDPEKTIKFNISGEDFPILISVIPAIIDLDGAQDLDRQKMRQQLLKIIIQKMPIDKNGDLVFDVDEAAELHNNAVRMLNKAVGINVLTTFADVDVADMADSTASDAADDAMGRVKQAIYDQAGISQMQFNTDGNLALQKSVLNDEASLYSLIQQYEDFLNLIIKRFNTSPKKMYFKVQMLGTTIYNYKQLSKLYKQQTQLGYSKMLPQIALGQSQSSILASAYFENEILDLVNVFIPPLSSNTMSGQINNNNNSKSNSGAQRGRPEKENDQKSEKTIANQQSAN